MFVQRCLDSVLLLYITFELCKSFLSVFGTSNDTLLVERPPTGSRRRRDITLPLDQQSANLFESSKSTTLLPKHESFAEKQPHSSATPTTHQDSLQSEVLVKNNETIVSAAATTAPDMMSTSIAVHPTVSPDVTMQQMRGGALLLMQQQSLQLQQLNSELTTSRMQLEQAKSDGERNTAQAKEKLLQELDLVKNQLKEVQEELHEEKMAFSKLKVLCL